MVKKHCFQLGKYNLFSDHKKNEELAIFLNISKAIPGKQGNLNAQDTHEQLCINRFGIASDTNDPP